MNTEDLIGKLVCDAHPVKQSPPPLALFARWSAIGVPFLAAGILLIGTRADIALRWQDFEFVLHTLIVVGVAVLAAAASFALSIPGRRQRLPVWIAGGALAAWLAWILTELMVAAEWHAGPGLKCLRNLLVLGVPLCTLMFFMIRRAAPLRLGAVGWLGALSAAAAADLATRFICKSDQALHAFAWHFVPVVVMSCGGMLLGRLLLRWKSPTRPDYR
jgi:hypothetical protein